MARAKSPEKREAILAASVEVIAKYGLEAPTSKIAQEAGIAEGTLFTYFENKDVLLNELYLDLKRDVYSGINDGFPKDATLEQQARHVWERYLIWVMDAPLKRKVSAKLYLSDRITPEAREEASRNREHLETMLRKIANQNNRKGLTAEFVSQLMSAMEDATVEFVAKHPKERKQAIATGFEAFWRAVG